MSLIFKSYNDYGFIHSKYCFENLPVIFREKRLPKLFHINDFGTNKKVGETDLTAGQLKNSLEQRKVIVSHFF
jgi:hypothetical protein